MDCFHSEVDDVLLERNIQDSVRTLKVEYEFAGVNRTAAVEYACNVVFNERVANNPKLLYAKSGAYIQKITEKGLERVVIMQQIAPEVVDLEEKKPSRLHSIYKAIVRGVKIRQ